MNDEIHQLFEFFKKKIPEEKRASFMQSIGFSSKSEILDLDDKKKEEALEVLRLEKRKRMTAADCTFILENRKTKSTQKKPPMYVPKKGFLDKSQID